MLFICLKGRVLVKIIGKCKKGDFIIAYDDGKGEAITKEEYISNRDYFDLIGISLEDIISGVNFVSLFLQPCQIA